MQNNLPKKFTTGHDFLPVSSNKPISANNINFPTIQSILCWLYKNTYLQFYSIIWEKLIIFHGIFRLPGALSEPLVIYTNVIIYNININYKVIEMKMVSIKVSAREETNILNIEM